ncbi:MAG: 30S ribosomal protein S20 [Candidatus Omnitrophica bacterium]|nr:30S ribosomal protein S20 [Candidatus Omnitrophota bacterium]
MPNLKSSCKRLRQSSKKQSANKAVKSELKTRVKEFKKLLEDNKIPEAENCLKNLEKKLMQSASKNILHKNKASRQISRLQLLLNSKKKAV